MVIMETSYYLILIVIIFSIDLLLFPSLASNPEETSLPKSPELGNWWRAITVSDLADVEGNTIGVGVKSKSFGVLFVKILMVAACAYAYFYKSDASSDKYSNRFVIATFMVALFIMVIKYIAYAGWFDDKQCSNYYISSLSSDRWEDTTYKVIYACISLLIAYTLRSHMIGEKEYLSVIFVGVLPFIIMGIHLLMTRLMYLGCKPNIIYDETCIVSPPTFYKEYITGTSSEADTKSKGWDYTRRGITVVAGIVLSFIFYFNHYSGGQRLAPLPILLLSLWLIFVFPLLLNWLTTVDVERQTASDETQSYMVDDVKKTRDYGSVSCTINKYGGLSGYFILFLVQLFIIRM